MLAEVSFFLNSVLEAFWQFLRSWYWLVLPAIFWPPFRLMWIFWRKDIFNSKQKQFFLEIKIPKENLKPVRAMEDVLNAIWQGFSEPPYFWEKWWYGKGNMDFQFEVVSIGGEIHFYVRSVLGYKRDIFEAAIYSQYPGAEITVKEFPQDDYTGTVPKTIPNEEWVMFGTDYTFKKPDLYPIRTYVDFEKEAEMGLAPGAESKRVDPMAVLLEGMAAMKPGEQLWFQIKPVPLPAKAAAPYIKQAHQLIDELSFRKVEKPKSVIKETFALLFGGKKQEKKAAGEIELIAPELRMTAKEKEIVEEVRRKTDKPLFLITPIRFIYLAKKEVFFRHRWRLIANYMGSFDKGHMNGFKVNPHTFTKISAPPPINIFDKRRLYVRKRRLFRLYWTRFEPRRPVESIGNFANWQWGYFVLNSEELASVFHFPSSEAAPAAGVPRVESKKAEAPPEVPMEE